MSNTTNKEQTAEASTYQIPEYGMPHPPTTFEGKYGFPMSDLNFESPMNFVGSLGDKSKMDAEERLTLLEVLQMYLEGVAALQLSAHCKEKEEWVQIIVSSKGFGRFLQRNKADDLNIESCQLKDGTFNIISDKGIYSMQVEGKGCDMNLNQNNVRYDWLMSYCLGLPEQPIVIEFKNNACKLSSSF